MPHRGSGVTGTHLTVLSLAIEMTFSLPFRLRHRLARFIPIPLHPLSFGQGLSLSEDLKRAGIEPEVIMDIGANIGQSAYEFYFTWPSVKVYCFEPVKTTFGELSSNTDSLENVSCHRVAIGNQEGEATIHVHDQSGMSSLSVEEGSRTERVPVTTLDRIADQMGIDQIDLLKVDVEGHEMNVLKGANKMLSQGNINSVLVEVGFSGSRHTPLSDVKDALVPQGFVLAGFHDQWSNPDNNELVHANALFVS